MIKFDEYSLEKLLSHKEWYDIHSTRKNNSSNIYITKRIDTKNFGNPLFNKYFINEATTLRKLVHPNIIRIENLKKTQHNYYIIMEYCNGGSLLQCLDRYKEKYHHSFTEEIVQSLMRKIINAVKYIHPQKIIHRDLKLNNILVNFPNKNDDDNINLMNVQIKITDFKNALNLKEYYKSLEMSKTQIGSPFLLVIGREIINNYCYDEIVDIWSIGIICYQMLIGNPPFVANNLEEIGFKIKWRKFKIPTNLSKEVISFMKEILQYEAPKRLTAETLSNHEFLTKNINEITKIKTNQDQEGQLNIKTKNNQSI